MLRFYSTIYIFHSAFANSKTFLQHCDDKESLENEEQMFSVCVTKKMLTSI